MAVIAYVVIAGLVSLAVWIVWVLVTPAPVDARPLPPALPAIFYCAHCGEHGKPRLHVRGSFWIEIFLWIGGGLPGILYTAWRWTTRDMVCPSCLAPNMIPAGSPRAIAAQTVITRARASGML